MEVTVAVVLVVISVALLRFLRRRREHFKYFKKLNINGPEPNLFFGNLLEYGYKAPSRCQVEWGKKYGETYGYFLGWHPFLITTNLELLKYVQIKNSPNFILRNMLIKDAGIPLEYVSKCLVFNGGEEWKLKRSILNPTFSSGKLKQITYLMHRTIQVFITKLQKAAGVPMEFKKHYSLLTLDNLLLTSFGTETNSQMESHSRLHQLVDSLSDVKYTNPIILLSLSFPTLGSFLVSLGGLVERIKQLLGMESLNELVEICRKVIRSRKSSPTQNGRKDLLQLMLDATTEESDENNLIADQPSVETSENNTGKSNAIRLDESEIIGNCVLFLAAGEDTTAALLSYASHLLASHPEVQDKLRQEILDNLNEQEVPDYSILVKMPYLDQVIKEALRLYPSSITFITRMATEDFEFGGKTFPKGITIQVPNYSLHRDPRYWNNPESFRPERFSAENKGDIYPMAYQPFGEGPRSCIGSRFAQIFAKLTLIRVLQNFKLEHPDTSTGKLIIQDKIFVIHPKPFYLKFTPISK